jgi:hypothetical protein
MSEEARQLQPSNQFLDTRSLVTIIFCSLVAQGLRGIEWLPYGIALPLLYYFALLTGYWFGRRPTLGFGPFALRLTVYIAILIAGLWAIPELLSHWIWKPMAHAAPILVVAILAYWMRPLYPSQNKRGRFLGGTAHSSPTRRITNRWTRAAERVSQLDSSGDA